ncbi:hypothetical protein PUMCH_000055 [Australozyma saopauloensis]|uniref:Vacuolar sorting protein Vps3844 C-terminal domain-containing protein n=1 Tax=Australozyma saopauloensis TaxID=291208 RepID=A0AAX4H2W2_9ASCO|nr:hypothetical protein PUMCH_000055 [[Candida] saopauloensis]
MKLASLCSLVLASALAVCASNVAVYEFSGERIIEKKDVQKVSVNTALLYLADKFGLDENYSLGGKDETLEFIDSVHRLDADEEKPSLLVILKGVDSPSNLIKDHEASFEVRVDKRKSVKHLTKALFKDFPKQYARLVNASHVAHLTEEIKYVSGSGSAELTHDFKLFHRELPQKWSNIVESFNSKQNVMENLDSSLQLVNDKLYISELMQLIKFSSKQHNDASVETDDADAPAFVVANLDSLFSLGSKLGYDARTYKVAKAALVDCITALQSSFDVTIVALGPEHKHACNKGHMSKRSQELSELFSNFAKRETSSSGACFADENECGASTHNCNSHGKCSKVGAKCWQCVCSPTFDKKTSKTTKWTGYDCAKKDIAAQAQLLLWTSIALLVTLVGGIKLLFNIGNDSLPGVLEAATLKKAS